MNKKQISQSAKEIASHGRFGDDQIIHVSGQELKGLASLAPGGKLPVNPKTGLHEAFFFLPFLAALAPAAAGAGAAAAGTAATLGTAAAGLTAGTGAAAGLAGLGAAAAPAAATAASALPAATGAAAGLGAAAAPTLAAAAPTAAAATGTTAAASGLGGLVAPTSFLGGVPMAGGTPAVTGMAAPASAAANTIAANTITGPLSMPSATATAGHGATALGAANMAGNAMPIPGLQAASAAPAAGAAKTGLGSLTGGLFGNMDASKMLQYGALAAMMMPKGGGGGSDDSGKSKSDIGAKDYSRGDEASAPDQGKSGGTGPEFNYFPRAHYFAKGGIVSMIGHARDREAVKQITAQHFAKGGLASLSNQDGGGADDEALIDATVQALQAGDQNNPAIQKFVQEFGPDALKDLLAKIGAQGQGDPGDGMSDSVPAQISGQGGAAPAQLSEGEYVVPSDVVAHLGNGSTQAGARQLQSMVARTRAARGAPSDGPTQIDPTAMMPS